MVELKTKNKGLFLFGVLLLSFANNVYSFAGGNGMTAWLLATDNYSFYALASALSIVGMMISLPAVGAMSNKLGLRNVVLMGIIIMAAACVGFQFCNNVYLFMVLRTVASFGAGMLSAAPYTLIGSTFELNTAIKYYGLIATANALGCLFGPLVSGLLIDNGYIMLSFIFWLPLAIIALVILLAAYPNIKMPSTKFDVLGLILLVVASLAFVLWTGLSGNLFPWMSAGMLLPVVSVVCAILLAKHSQKVENPTVPFYVFKYKRFGVAFFINIIINLVPTCITGYLLAYVLGPMGESATIGSTTSMPYTAISAVLGLFVGGILAKNFKKNVRNLQIIASVAACISLGIMSILQPESSMAMVWLASGLGGITASLVQTCMTPFFQYGMDQKDYGAAQGMFIFAATCGATLFFSVVGVLVNAMGGEIRSVFWCALVLSVICLVVTILKFKITDEEMA